MRCLVGSLVGCLMLAGSAWAQSPEAVEVLVTEPTIRVFERHSVVHPAGTVPPGGNCTPGTAASGPVQRWYEITYAHEGRVYRRALSYHPGTQVVLDVQGDPLRVPFDNGF